MGLYPQTCLRTPPPPVSGLLAPSTTLVPHAHPANSRHRALTYLSVCLTDYLFIYLLDRWTDIQIDSHLSMYLSP